MKRLVLVASFALSAFQNAQAISFPLTSENWTMPEQSAEAIGNYNYEGIVGISNCSGSIVRFDDSQASDLAMVLTNGHCVNMNVLTDGVVLVDQKSNKTFDVLSPTAGKLGKVTAQKLIYATMTKTDVGLYQLRETYQEIATKYKTRPLTLSRTAPADHTNIEILSGYWKRGYSCQIETTVFSLKEGGWTMFDSVRYSRPGCETIGGTSGSPVIEAGTRTVVAVNNTGNESGKRCEMNNPCEVDQNGKVFYEKGLSYGQQIYWFYSCRNSNGALDLSVAGCQLPKPVSFEE